MRSHIVVYFRQNGITRVPKRRQCQTGGVLGQMLLCDSREGRIRYKAILYAELFIVVKDGCGVAPARRLALCLSQGAERDTQRARRLHG